MEILRIQPYSDVKINFTIPEIVTSESEIKVTVIDMSDLSVQGVYSYSNTGGDTIEYSLSAKYDTDYQVIITAERDPEDVFVGTEIIFDDIYSIVRPYVNPSTMAQTASEITEYARYEEIARAVVDSVIPEGFYYKKKVVETVGLGADYLPLWTDAKKILSVFENNVLVTDRTYEITKDKTAITETMTDMVNRDEQAPLIIPAASSDIVDANLPPLRGFPNGYDYKLILETGYPAVPSDVARAATLLIDDIKCGRLDYYQRYITSYNTDQFRLQFDKRMFEGTGNIVVDKILSKYSKSITRLGVL
jgi:hypothetical protein